MKEISEGLLDLLWSPKEVGKNELLILSRENRVMILDTSLKVVKQLEGDGAIISAGEEE